MCPPAAARSSATPLCPTTGTPGRPVAEETVRSLVSDPARLDLEGRHWHYCGVADCAVVYFDTDGRTIEKTELTVRVATLTGIQPNIAHDLARPRT